MPKFFAEKKTPASISSFISSTNQDQTRGHNREEKSLRHVVMVAKGLDDNKPKIHLKFT